MLREYIWLACAHMRLGRSVAPTMVTPCSTTVSPGLVSSQLPLLLGREVDDDASRASSTCTMSAVTRTGARLPGMSAVEMTTSALATCRAMASACFFLDSSLSSLA